MSMEVQADYAEKVKTVEDRLVEPIHDRLIDADRLVRAQRWAYGFPVWAMYRAAYCGDNRSVTLVKDAADAQESGGGIPAWVWIVIAVIVIGGYFALR